MKKCLLLSFQLTLIIMLSYGQFPEKFGRDEDSEKILLNDGKSEIKGIEWYEPDVIVGYDKEGNILDRDTYTYDSDGNLLMQLYEIWKNDMWVNNWRDTYTYDSDGNLLTQLREDWRNDIWVNLWRKTYTYNSDGNKLTHLQENWRNDIWVNYSRYTYTYDPDGNLLTQLEERWENDIWVNYSRYTYTYDSDGNRLTQLEERWENDMWVNYSLYTYTYDSDGNLLMRLKESWIIMHDNSQREIYTYDSDGNRLTHLYETWNGIIWVNWSHLTYTYDSDGNLLTELAERWRNDMWVSNGRWTYTYDSDGNRLTQLKELWENEIWNTDNSIIYRYDNGNCVEVILETINNDSNYDIFYNNMKSKSRYNNSTVSKIEISYIKIEDKTSVGDLQADESKIYSYGGVINIGIKDEAEARFEVIDATGRLVKGGTFVLSTAINVNHKGVYLVRVLLKSGAVITKTVISQ